MKSQRGMSKLQLQLALKFIITRQCFGLKKCQLYIWKDDKVVITQLDQRNMGSQVTWFAKAGKDHVADF